MWPDETTYPGNIDKWALYFLVFIKYRKFKKRVKYNYMNKKDIRKEEVILDFNKSLKPICFYNSIYKGQSSLMENNINIAITAGDKTNI